IEGDPLRGQNAHVGGIIYVQKCCIYGMAWLLGIHTGGILHISESEIWGEVENNDPPWLRKAVIVSEADIGASLRLTNGFVAHGFVDCSTSRVRGDLDLRDAQFLNPHESGVARAVDATNADIGANLQFDRSSVQG